MLFVFPGRNRLGFIFVNKTDFLCRVSLSLVKLLAHLVHGFPQHFNRRIEKLINTNARGKKCIIVLKTRKTIFFLKTIVVRIDYILHYKYTTFRICLLFMYARERV